MSTLKSVSALLDRDAPAIWIKLDIHERDRLAADFVQWQARRPPPREEEPGRWEQIELTRYLRDQLGVLSATHGQLSHRYRILQERLELTELPSVRDALLLEFLGELDAGPRQLAGDRLALSRWLDIDAVTERYDRKRAAVERRIRFCLDRIGALAARLCTDEAHFAGVPMWRALDLESNLQPLLAFPGDVRIREAALRSVRVGLSGLRLSAGMLVGKSTVQYIYRAILDQKQSLWLQCEALQALAQLAPQELESIAAHRVTDPGTGDAMFFRRRLAEALAGAIGEFPGYTRWLTALARDASPYVRQGVAGLLPSLPSALADELLAALAVDDCAAVAAQALLQAPALLRQPHADDPAAAWVLAALEASADSVRTDTFVLRVAMRVAPELVAEAAVLDAGRAPALAARIEARLTVLHTSHPSTAVRRTAAATRERLHAGAGLPGLSCLTELPIGARARTLLGRGDMPAHAATDPIAMARALLTASEHGFGFNLQQVRQGWRVLRDFRWRPRLWRILHEARRPATDKRQNYSHLRGRVYPGLLHVPGAGVSELSQTKVPGEPLHISDEGGWRPWLPLLDQVLSALDQGWPTQPLRIVTSEGVTRVMVPARLWPRLRAKWRLSHDFARIAALRNWTDDSPFPEHAFVDALRACGIECILSPHSDRNNERYPVDPRVRRFFSAGAAWMPLHIAGMRDYFYSIYQNSLAQLLVFVGLLGAWFFGQHLWLNRIFQLARRSLPLVMGGWGTRGKSGTERLKAAVMNAMGLRVVSKTTGCEAMFLFGYPNRPLTEMFLFRPYDKATIWEQARLARMAADLGADVFLWECMGLNPGYVRVLQQDWMRDDVSTITNCFPDHEDIQGPAGVDLPLVIGQFIPQRGVLYTSEENMLPYLREQARRMDTPCIAVDWLDTGLLTPDILARFPYQEHPTNVALVARMFEGMGLRRDFSLKEMADRVVPDLGVLKTYPEARFEDRRIEFINGMSANERHGCLSNWARTGMGLHRLDTDPGIWTCTVVNNRADRVARSQVFASILVNDIGADRHFLIGGNLDGLLRFVREAFDEFVDAYDWQETERGIDAHHAMLDAVLQRWRVPLDAAQADARLRAACGGLELELRGNAGEDAAAWLAALEAHAPQHHPEIHAQWQRDQAEASLVVRMQALLSTPGASTAAQIKDALWTLFSARIVPVWDYNTPGNVLVRDVLHAAPAGLRIRCMGIQNIKGTGLDFIYRWQAWDTHVRMFTGLTSTNAEVALLSAQALASSTELGVLESEPLRQTIAQARTSAIGQTDMFQAQLARIEATLETQLRLTEGLLAQPGRIRPGWQASLSSALERFLDAGDAVRRRRRADRIYRDLVAGRIASTRAAHELKKLNQRQKGGWLVRD